MGMTDQSPLLFSRRRKVPVIYQLEAAECGLACLAMVCGYYGKHVGIFELRHSFRISTKGATVQSLVQAARSAGLLSRVLKVGMGSIHRLQLPAVLHWNLNHFVVLAERKGGKYLINDPARGAHWLDEEEVSKQFTGIAMELTPQEGFETRKRVPALTFSTLLRGVVGARGFFVQLALLSLVLQLLALVSPLAVRLIIDNAAMQGDSEFLLVLAAGLGIVILASIALTVLRSKLIVYFSNQFSYHVAVRVFAHMVALPVAYFQARSYGDIVMRYRAVEPIRDLITKAFIPAVLDGIMGILTLLVLFLLSPLLALIPAAAAAGLAAVYLASAASSRSFQEARTTTRAIDISRVLELVRSIETVKGFGKEDLTRGHWQNLHAQFINANINVDRLAARLATVKTSATLAEEGLVIVIGAAMILGGSLTVGTLLAFYLLNRFFIEKISQFTEQFLAFRDTSVQLDQLADITTAEPEQTASRSAGLQDVKGALSVDDVWFRYGDAEEWVLKGASFEVEPGEHLAIAGASGGGKTTLLKVASGLLMPTSGAVRLDGIPIARIDVASLREALLCVQQNDHLLTGTIAENISFFSPTLDWDRIVACAKMAYIYDEIMQFPMQFHTFVGDLQNSISGGQKQRICLARAFYQTPKVLGIDEGTSHLDPRAESAVTRTMSGLGITRITVAHRIETLRTADRILLIEDGKLRPVSLDEIKEIGNGRASRDRAFAGGG